MLAINCFPVTAGKARDCPRSPTSRDCTTMNFPPRWASSVAVLSWISALETAWCVCELASEANMNTERYKRDLNDGKLQKQVVLDDSTAKCT